MKKTICDHLQIREVFHFEFLRWMSKKIKAECYALKGGVNLRFFFNSIRYSEDMDLDIRNIDVFKLQDVVMQILKSASFKNVLMPFGISDIVPPNIISAKQTETTQRFKIHLIASGGEDLFTKIEFSRRKNKGQVMIQPVSDSVTRLYKMSPVLVPHYDVKSSIMQKIDALASRTLVQARDIFDIYTLSSQFEGHIDDAFNYVSEEKIAKAYENIFKIDFVEYRDTVISYLSAEDQNIFGKAAVWEEVRLRAGSFIEKLKEQNV